MGSHKLEGLIHQAQSRSIPNVLKQYEKIITVKTVDYLRGRMLSELVCLFQLETPWR